jgi:Transglutaminase-like superfamily
MLGSPYALTPNTFYCFSDRHCIFLNLNKDQYLAVDREDIERAHPWLVLPGQSELPPKLEGSVAGDLQSAVESTIENLVGAGILVNTTVADTGQYSIPPRPPTRQLPEFRKVHRGSLFRHAHIFLAASLRAHHRLTHEPIAATVERVARRGSWGRRAVSHFDWRRARILIGIFDVLRPLFPRNYLCLFDSLALIEFLAHYKLFPHWIFGVRSEPFCAHCWLQEGDVVLNDRLYRVEPYTSIMEV